RDPPFSALDLVSCRNVLIYLEPDLQQKVVSVFHYALRPGGCLLLGSAESPETHPDLFEVESKVHRVFRRAQAMSRPHLDLPLDGRPLARSFVNPPREPRRIVPPAIEAFERMMLAEYCAPGAVVNQAGNILCVAGRTGRFLQPPAGPLTTNVLDVAQRGLRLELRGALRAAVETGQTAIRQDILVEDDGAPVQLRLTVRPLSGAGVEPGLFVVVLQEQAPVAESEEEALAREPDRKRGGGASAARELELERELQATRADLRSTVEDLEASNADLVSSNEEMLSTNEELQSANEELYTAQEELRSVNEELTAVNSQLQQKVKELARANDDLANLFASTSIATLFLDPEMRVARFTPAATTLFRLREGDLGRPITDLAPRFCGRDVVEDAAAVLRSLRPVEGEVRSEDGERWYSVRVLPYRTLEGQVAGVVLTFVDVTGLRLAQAELRRQAGLLHLSHDAMLVWRLEDRDIETWNRGAEELYGYSDEEARGRVVDDFLQTHPAPAMKQILGTLRSQRRWEGELNHATKSGARVVVSAKMLLALGEDGVERVLETNRDITAHKRAVEELRAEHARTVAVLESIGDAFYSLDHDLRFTYVNQRALKTWSKQAEELLGRRIWDVFPPEKALESHRQMEAARAGGRHLHSEVLSPTLGTWVDVDYYPTTDGLSVFFRDITERKRAEEELRRSVALYRAIARGLPDCAVFVVDSELRYLVAEGPLSETLELTGARLEKHLLVEVLSEEARAIAEPHFRAALGGAPGSYETCFAGRVLWAQYAPLRDEAGRIVAALALVLDITGRKQAEAEKAALIEQLQHSLKMEAVGRLAGGVAHDFNNLLTTILGNASAALGEVSSDSPLAEGLGEILHASESAAALTRQLLAFSRKQIIEPRVVDPNELVVQLQKMLSRLIGEDVSLITRRGAGVGPVRVDPGQFEQILVNLAVNARDAMPTGGELTIETA
ncbi:MAG: PAS domain-containing protein, partial [Deltaproteobacteria bacterium]|nr:PAS domain-containing protein [Deltaproteobacteria bacterium]